MASSNLQTTTSEELRAAVVRRLQEKLPGAPLSELEEVVDRAAEYFCSETKRQRVPVAAFYLWQDMAMRIHSLAGSTASEGKVTSIKRGDTAIQYSDTQIAEAMLDITSKVRSYRVVRTV